MIEVVKSRYPDIELEELYPHFPRMVTPGDPALSGYSWEDCHRGFLGAGGLFLVAEEPMRQLAINAGKDGAVIVDNVRRQQKEQDDIKVGYDVLREVYVNMVKQGIIDPVKVTRSAVENAASIGAMILTTEALITDIPEKEKAQMPSMPEY